MLSIELPGVCMSLLELPSADTTVYLLHAENRVVTRLILYLLLSRTSATSAQSCQAKQPLTRLEKRAVTSTGTQKLLQYFMLRIELSPAPFVILYYAGQVRC